MNKLTASEEPYFVYTMMITNQCNPYITQIETRTDNNNAVDQGK